MALPDLALDPFLLVDSSKIAGDANKVDSMVRCGLGAAGDIAAFGGDVTAEVGWAATVQTFEVVTGDGISKESQFSGTGIFYYSAVNGKFYSTTCNYTFDGSGKILLTFFPQPLGVGILP